MLSCAVVIWQWVDITDMAQYVGEGQRAWTHTRILTYTGIGVEE